MIKQLFKRPETRFVIFLGLIVGFMVLGNMYSIDADKIDAYFEKVPLAYSSALFVVFYVVGTFFLWHLKDPLKIVGAIIFGATISTVLIYIAEIINAYIFFNISRILGKGFVERKLSGRFRNFYEKLEHVNLGWVFLMRVVPLIPYRVLDLSFGLSKYSFKKYLVVVLLASPPRIYLIQFVLAAVRGFSMEAITQYFMENQAVALGLCFYFLLAVLVAFKIKRI